jgi:hypothetical protein
MWRFLVRAPGSFIPVFATMFVAYSLTYAAAPKGWFLAGNAPQDYNVGTRTLSDGPPQSIAYLRSNAASTHGFGTLMQSFSAGEYGGHRVRFSAEVKSEGITGWAGLWMRADKERTTVAFDNMQSRPIRGTQAWNRYEVVLDIPADATSLHFGVLLTGPGEIDISGLKFEIVPDPRVPQIGPAPMQSKPVNLDLAP